MAVDGALAPVKFSVESEVLRVSHLGSRERSLVWIKTERGPLGFMVDLSVSLISSAPSHAVSTEYAVSVDMELHLHLAWGSETAGGTVVSAGGAVGLGADQQASKCSPAAVPRLLWSKENVATISLPADLTEIRLVASLTLTWKHPR